MIKGRDSVKFDILKNHVIAFRNKGYCTQCIFPWYDGMCECNREFNEQSDQYDRRISRIAMEFYKKGDHLNDLRKLAGLN